MRFLADENFDNRILRGIRRVDATMDILRVQDTEILGAADQAVLEWAAGENRILLTHDVNTIPRYAFERVRANKPMPGIIAVHAAAPIGAVIDDILLVIGAAQPADFHNQVLYVPL